MHKNKYDIVFDHTWLGLAGPGLIRPALFHRFDKFDLLRPDWILAIAIKLSTHLVHVQILDVLPPEVHAVVEAIGRRNLLVARQAPLRAPALH